jgi:hypothetical protein
MTVVWFARCIVRPVALLQDDRFDASILAATVRTDRRRCTHGLTPKATTALRVLYGASWSVVRPASLRMPLSVPLATLRLPWTAPWFRVCPGAA